MKHNAILAILVCILVSAFASCGSGEDYTVITVSPSTCVISNVELGKIPCVVNLKTTDGEDSTYVASITGSNYPMSIDHYGGRIFNVDSLPYGCDVAKVTFASLASSGTLSINSLSQDVDTFFVATDSTDFRKPRKVTVYAADGVATRSYWMEVRVHQEEGDAFKWQQMADGVEAFSNVTLSASLAHQGVLYAFGQENNQPVVLTALASAPAEWNMVAANKLVASPIVYEGCFYALSEGTLVQSVDAVNWNNVATDLSKPLLTLVSGSTAIYGVTSAGFVASEDGATWTLQEADDVDYLPTENCSAACLPSPIDETYEDIIVVGSRNGMPVVWKLNVDKTGMYKYQWNYYPESPINGKPCPELPMRNIFAYDGATLLLGTEIDGTSVVYLSRDNGRTGQQKEIPQMDGVTVPFVSTVDANHFIWVITQNGDVKKGRFNRLGWVKQDSHFYQ